MGRATQGVRLIRINEGDEISSVEKIEKIIDDIDENTDIDSTENKDGNTPEENIEQ